jgi:large subunit ribosomal protein L30
MIVTQIKSAIGALANHRATLRSLGLRRIGQSVEVKDTQQNRGYLHAVRHLVLVDQKTFAINSQSPNFSKASVSVKRSTKDKRG